MARERGIATTHEGLEGLRALPVYPEIGIVFDATSAYAHKVHDEALRADGKLVVDLTPAANGPFTIPPVNMDEHLEAPNVNMVNWFRNSVVWEKRVTERVELGGRRRLNTHQKTNSPVQNK